jgi:hypothetical protein
MVTEDLRSLRNNRANYIFRNGRLFVGWFVCQDQRTEAWLEKAIEPTGENTANKPKTLRIYTSADGSGKLMNVNELHPALLVHYIGDNSQEFLSKCREYKLHFLAERYDDVVTGRYKYTECEGGELKVIEGAKMFPRPTVQVDQGVKQKQMQGQKRKRSRCDSEDYECSGASEKRPRPDTDYADYGDDDDDDDDEEVYFKRDPALMGAMNQDPTFVEPINPNPRQHKPVQGQSHEQIATAISDLDITGKLVQGHDKAAEQKNDIRGSAIPDPMALTALLDTFKKTLLDYMRKWATCAEEIKSYFLELTGKLYYATELGEIMNLSRNVLQYMKNYCILVRNMHHALQSLLMDSRATGMPVDIVAMHESLNRKYEEKEQGLRR